MRGRRGAGGRGPGPGLGRGLRALVAAGVVLYACGGDGPTDPPPGPTPGVLEVRLTVPVGADDGAVRLEVSGPGIQGLTAAGSFELFQGGSGTRRTAILVGTLQAGTVLRIQVADIGQVSAYSARVLEVAAGDYTLEDPSRYQAAVVAGT